MSTAGNGGSGSDLAFLRSPTAASSKELTRADEAAEDEKSKEKDDATIMMKIGVFMGMW